MKIKIIGRLAATKLLPLLQPYNCELVEKNPQLIITYGGDGTLLGAERDYPGVAKLPLRPSALCPVHNIQKQLSDFFSAPPPLTELIKLRGTAKGKTLLAINDIFIHNLDPVSAVRYRVWIDNQLYANEIVGDGVGVSTVHGSTAYYRSITHSIFRTGIGLAFCNSTEVVNHLVLPENSIVRVQIVRGPAVLVADNAPERLEMHEGDEAIIDKSSQTARIYGLNNFMCPHCRALRHPNKNPF